MVSNELAEVLAVTASRRCRQAASGTAVSKNRIAAAIRAMVARLTNSRHQSSARIARALGRAASLQNAPWRPEGQVAGPEMEATAGRSLAQPARHFALGDAQAPCRQVLEVLDHHGLLGDDGWLAEDVGLVAVGDYFDYATDDVSDGAAQGQRILRWLAEHDPGRVTLLKDPLI